MALKQRRNGEAALSGATSHDRMADHMANEEAFRNSQKMPRRGRQSWTCSDRVGC